MWVNVSRHKSQIHRTEFQHRTMLLLCPGINEPLSYFSALDLAFIAADGNADRAAPVDGLDDYRVVERFERRSDPMTGRASIRRKPVATGTTKDDGATSGPDPSAADKGEGVQRELPII